MDKTAQPLRVPEVAFDESGNTGGDLLSEDQPFYVLASFAPDKSDLRDRLRAVTETSQRELKFSSLRRSVKGQSLALELIRGVGSAPAAQIFVVHKRFMLVAKMVDLLVEPLAHKTGHDLYRHGEHVALTNLWYQAVLPFCGDSEVQNLLTSFARMVRTGAEDAAATFYRSVEDCQRSCESAECAQELELLDATRPIAAEFITDPGAPVSAEDLDPAGTSLLNLSARWGEELQTPFAVVHDESSVIRRWTPLLERLMRPDQPPMSWLR